VACRVQFCCDLLCSQGVCLGGHVGVRLCQFCHVEFCRGLSVESRSCVSGLGQSRSVGRDVARFDPISLGAVCRSSRGRVRRGVTWSVKAVN